MMSDEGTADENRPTADDIVTTFLHNSCRMRPRLSRSTLEAALKCFETTTLHPSDDTEADFIPLITGSVAEFYIEPMLSCVGDIDVMSYKTSQLAVPRGCPPPLQLPPEFHHYVRVFEIIDSEVSGYVYLQLRYLLTECYEDDELKLTSYSVGESYIKNRRPIGDVSGPAVKCGTMSLSVDLVLCMRCLSWPPQAAEWRTRHRNYSCPNSALINRVVNDGCDVVAATHRGCRHDEFIGKYQWRLSFSRAEVLLMNNWKREQQILYHMLRVFVKTERLTDSVDDSDKGTLSNYHLKTLMLWASELEPEGWWTGDSSLITVLCKLLRILAVYLIDSSCSHYFVDNCNLLGNSFNVSWIGSLLLTVDKTRLTSWFVNNYIGKCAQRCPADTSRLFADISETPKLQKAATDVLAWREVRSMLDDWFVFDSAEFSIAGYVSNFSLSSGSCSCLMTELRTLSEPLVAYFTAVVFLHVTSRITRGHGFEDDVIGVLTSALDCHSTGTRTYFSSCEWLLRKAGKLMKDVANKSLGTVDLIKIELAKAYLHRALKCNDCDSHSIYCLANVYLATLYYTTGQPEMAIDHCEQIIDVEDHSSSRSVVVQRNLLANIYDDVDSSLGLALFYQYIRSNSLLNRTHLQHIGVFTTELFARYLHVRCLSVPETFPPRETERFWTQVGKAEQLFLEDVVLLKYTGMYRQSCHCSGEAFIQRRSRRRRRPAVNPTEPNACKLIELLQQAALEHLTTYRRLAARDFPTVPVMVISDFEALYAYRRGDYRRCLRLCSENVETLLCAVPSPHVVISPELVQLLDDDIVCLTALTLIVDPDCRSSNAGLCVTQLTMSLYLLTQSQLQVRDSTTSLARTLDCIKVALVTQSSQERNKTINYLTLNLIRYKVVTYLGHAAQHVN